MNLSRNPSRDELATLLADCDDAASNHVLWVHSNGDVEISPLNDETIASAFGTRPDLRFRYATMKLGNNECGAVAASDPAYVDELYASLVEDWDKGTTGYVEDWASRL